MGDNIHTIAFNITLACNFNCRCCAKPSEESYLMPISQLKACQVMDHFFEIQLLKRVHFTGGEPFLEYNLLANLAEHANTLGISSGVVTNASWCTSKNIVVDRIEELRSFSLDLIAISYDAYHAEFISLEKILLLIEEAKNIGQEVIVLSVYSDKTSLANDNLLKELTSIVPVPISKRWLVPSGRAPVSIKFDHNYGFPLSEFDSEKCIQNLGTVHPDGTFFPCCSAGCHSRLALGNIFELGASKLLDIRTSNNLIEILKEEGPLGVLCRLPDSVKRRFTSKKYASSCHLCYEIIKDNEAFDYAGKIRPDDIDLADSILISSAINAG